MKITNNINNGIATIKQKNPSGVFRGLPADKIGKVSSFFLKNGNAGEATSVLVDIAGKAVLVPLVIMFNPFSKQKKEDKKYTAIKNPLAGLIQLGLEVPVFYYTAKGIKSLANKGLLDKDPNFSYNAKLHKDMFLRNLDKLVKANPPNSQIADEIRNLTAQLHKKKLSQKLVYDFNQVISKFPPTNSINSDLKDTAKKSLDNYKIIDKRLFHLGSRFSFIAALLLIPVMCAIENWLHPKVVSLFNNSKTKKGGCK